MMFTYNANEVFCPPKKNIFAKKLLFSFFYIDRLSESLHFSAVAPLRLSLKILPSALKSHLRSFKFGSPCLTTVMTDTIVCCNRSPCAMCF